MSATAWPALPLADWRDTKETLHRYCQVLGKLRLAKTPFRNHWWHATLYVDVHGLTTGAMPDGERMLEVRLDFVHERVALATSDGDCRSFPLTDGLACATFYEQLFGALADLGARVVIDPRPFDLDGPPLSEDREHCAYDADAVRRYFRLLQCARAVLLRFSGWFNGKQSPVQLFWHSFDLAYARYSGRAAPPRPGADRVTAEAYSHEVIAFGFWPGDEHLPAPTYYSYTAPAPPGLAGQPLRPEAARWDEGSGNAYLDLDVVRVSDDPEATLLAFFQSAYLAGARPAGWDLDAFATRAAPPAR